MATIDTLTDRQKDVLRSVVQCFIQSATPVASERLAKDFFANLSPATIRNVLAQLEDKGYIGHPYTSAGRIPTDMGYRVYVDRLMTPSDLTHAEKRAIEEHMKGSLETDDVLQAASRILGRISHQLGIVSGPQISVGVLERIELVSLASTRVLAILTMKSGLIRTILMEVTAEIPRERLENVSRLLNERLAGLTLKQIRESFADRIRDLQDEGTGLIQLFFYSSQKLLDDIREHGRLYVSGARNVLEQPEFENPKYVRGIFEILENEDLMTHILEQIAETPTDGASVAIGSETRNKRFKDCSVVVSSYRVGESSGVMGVIGPKRMNYEKTLPLVDFAAHVVSQTLS